MDVKFDDIDNDVLGCFVENRLSIRDQMKVTDSLKSYKDLWVLANIYHPEANLPYKK